MLGMTTGAGYTLPKNLALVTREILDYDETNGKRPAVIIQTETKSSQLVGCGGVAQTTLRGRLVFYFDTNTNGIRPVTYANQYLRAARDVLVVDRSRGGHPSVLTTTIPDEPTALLWKAGQAFEATLIFEILTMHEGGA